MGSEAVSHAPAASDNANTMASRSGGGPRSTGGRRTSEEPLLDASALATPLYGGRYELLELLGVGASGSVYRARDTELNEVVALKVLRKELVGDATTVERFRNEVRLARRVTHHNVARVFDIGEHEGEKFLTMELVTGRSLTQHVQDRETGRRRALPLSELIDLVDQICAGLDAAHHSGVVHCDLKPDNILLAQDGRVVVTDFGISRALLQARSAAAPDRPSTTTPGARPTGKSPRATPIQFDGTPMYVSPEQINGELVDARTDVYSLGAVLYELLTGEPPFSGGSTVAVLAARVLRPPPDPRSLRPDLGPDIAQVITRCLAVSPSERFQHAGELATALRQAAQRLSSDQTQAFIVPSLPTEPRARPSAAEATRDALPPVLVEGSEGADVAGLMTARIPARPAQTNHTVLVARFDNLGPREDEDLALGLCREFAEALAALPGVYVYGMAAQSSLPAAQREPLAAAQALSASWLIRGTLRRGGELLRLSLQLLRTENSALVFSARSDCQEASLLSLAESLLADLAHVLGVPPPQTEASRSLGPAAASASVLSSPAPAPAGPSEEYLRARALYERGDLQSVQQGVSMLERALSRSPGDPRLLMYYALAQSRLWFYGDSNAAGQAISAAERLVALQPRRAESHLALASVRFQGADALGAVQATVKALSIRPDLPDAHELLGRTLVETGPVREGLAHLAQARALDPGMIRVIADQARVLALLGRFDRAHELLSNRSLVGQTFAIQWILLARLCLWQKDTARAEEYMRDPELLAGKYPRARLLFAAAARRTRIEPQDVLAAGLASDKSSPRGRTFFFQMHAELQAGFGQHELAVRSVARSVDAGLSDLLWLEHCPPLVPLAKDPRMIALRQVVYSRAFAVREALASLPRSAWSVSSPISASSAESK